MAHDEMMEPIERVSVGFWRSHYAKLLVTHVNRRDPLPIYVITRAFQQRSFNHDLNWYFLAHVHFIVAFRQSYTEVYKHWPAEPLRVIQLFGGISRHDKRPQT
jgi:hypothetical protein